MKVSRTLTRIAFGLASAANVAQAWPRWLPPVNTLVARASDDTVGQNTAVASTSTSDSATSSAEGFTISETGTSSSGSSSTRSGSSTTSRSGSTTRTTATSNSTTYSGQAGSMSMISPTTAVYKPLYKAGDTITWVWNYTNIQAAPTAIDVYISCSSITQSWLLTANMSFASTATYTWDSNVQATNAQQPLVPNNYTLIVKDSDDSITAADEAGYLGVQSTFTFGLYTPQPYSNLSNWECTTCIVGGASRGHEMVIPMIVTSLFASAGFMWFLSGLDL